MPIIEENLDIILNDKRLLNIYKDKKVKDRKLGIQNKLFQEDSEEIKTSINAPLFIFGFFVVGGIMIILSYMFLITYFHLQKRNTEVIIDAFSKILLAYLIMGLGTYFVNQIDMGFAVKRDCPKLKKLQQKVEQFEQEAELEEKKFDQYIKNIYLASIFFDLYNTNKIDKDNLPPKEILTEIFAYQLLQGNKIEEFRDNICLLNKLMKTPAIKCVGLKDSKIPCPDYSKFKQMLIKKIEDKTPSLQV